MIFLHVLVFHTITYPQTHTSHPANSPRAPAMVLLDARTIMFIFTHDIIYYIIINIIISYSAFPLPGLLFWLIIILEDSNYLYFSRPVATIRRVPLAP